MAEVLALTLAFVAYSGCSMAL